MHVELCVVNVFFKERVVGERQVDAGNCIGTNYFLFHMIEDLMYMYTFRRIDGS